MEDIQFTPPGGREYATWFNQHGIRCQAVYTLAETRSPEGINGGRVTRLMVHKGDRLLLHWAAGEWKKNPYTEESTEALRRVLEGVR